MSDHIIYYRSTHDDWLFNASKIKSKFEAWIDLVVLSTEDGGDDASYMGNGPKIETGQSNRSLDGWAKRWGWSRSKVSRFLDFIEEQGYIHIEGEKSRIVISVFEYERYLNASLGPMPDYVSINDSTRQPARSSVRLRREREKERGKMSNSLRYDILKRDGFKCKACGASADDSRLAVDHIIPIAKGGKSTFENLQTLCFPCNAGKCAKL